MNAESLSLVAGAAWAVALAYIPGLSTWFGKLQPDQKRGVVALALLATAAVTFGLSCAGWLASFWPTSGVTCDQAGVARLLIAFFLSLSTNQGTYLILPKHGVRQPKTAKAY